MIALWKAIFPDDPPWNDPAVVIRRKLEVQPDLLFVATSPTSQVIGTVIAGYDGVRGWIYHLAVDPTFRRMGIGRALMRAAEEGMGKLGCPKVNLQVRTTNASAVSFYHALGYAVEDRVSLGKRLEKAD